MRVAPISRHLGSPKSFLSVPLHHGRLRHWTCSCVTSVSVQPCVSPPLAKRTVRLYNASQSDIITPHRDFWACLPCLFLNVATLPCCPCLAMAHFHGIVCQPWSPRSYFDSPHFPASLRSNNVLLHFLPSNQLSPILLQRAYDLILMSATQNYSVVAKKRHPRSCLQLRLRGFSAITMRQADSSYRYIALHSHGPQSFFHCDNGRAAVAAALLSNCPPPLLSLHSLF